MSNPVLDFWLTLGKVTGMLTCPTIKNMLKDLGVTDDEILKVIEAFKLIIKVAYKE